MKNNNDNNKRYINTINKYKSTEFDYYDSKTDILSYFKYCSASSNFVYYKCIYRRNKCPGTKKNIQTKEILTTTSCDPKINHQMINMNDFRKLYETNKLNEVPMKSLKMQKFYARIYFEKNNDSNIIQLRKKFKEDTGVEFLLGRIKCSLLGSLKGKEFYEICNIISEKNDSIIIKFFDIRYNIKVKE